MHRLRAHVRNGRLVLDEPTELPKGEVVYLRLAEQNDDDDLDEEERAALHAALDESLAEAGETVDFAEAIAALRRSGP